MSKETVDFIGNGASEGQVANYISQGGFSPVEHRPFLDSKGRACITAYKGFGDPADPKSYANKLINTNATLRKDEWKQMDDALLDISRYRLGGAQDLINAGLTYNLGNGLGTTVLEYQDLGDSFEAELSMDGEAKGKGDRLNYGIKYLPIPIIHVDFIINKRQLESSRKSGNPLDTTSISQSGRKVMERLENMLFTNTEYAFGGGTIYSYVNHPDRNTVTILDWSDGAVTPVQILADTQKLKQASLDAYHYGPWKMYIPSNFETRMDEDYDATTPGTTIRERLLKINGISSIEVNDTLAADNVLLVQMTPDVVRLVNGMALSVIEWMSGSKFVTNYKVLRISVPQIRSDQDGNSGVTHGAVA